VVVDVGRSQLMFIGHQQHRLSSSASASASSTTTAAATVVVAVRALAVAVQLSLYAAQNFVPLYSH
jgi:hypothetical protein